MRETVSQKRSLGEDFPDTAQIFRCIDRDKFSLAARLNGLDRDAIFKSAQLLQTFNYFKGRRRKLGKSDEAVARIGVESDVLENLEVFRTMPGEGNERPRKIERPAANIPHRFHHRRILIVRFTDVFDYG